MKKNNSSTITFHIDESESTFLDPSRGYNPTTVRFQVRRDPLTGRTGHFSHFGVLKAQCIDFESYNNPEKKGFCPFCLPNRTRVTPKFPPDVFIDGRVTRGEATLIPNLYPYDVYSGIMIMTDDHVVRLSAFNERRLFDSLALGFEFFRKIRSIDPGLSYYLMTWNYMPPSGGGLVHPHQQYFVTNNPGNQFMDELGASKAYFDANQESFWKKLVQEESILGQRYISQLGNTDWLTSFISMGFMGDVCCILNDVYSIEDVRDAHVHDLVSGILNVFKYYESAGVYSFNAALFMGPTGQQFFPCHFRITPRTFLNTRDFAPDMNFFQTLLSEPICVKLPEVLCSEIKVFF